MSSNKPIVAKLSRYHMANRNPQAAVDFDAATLTLTLANGEHINLGAYSNADETWPATFSEACGWWQAIRRGQPLPLIPRKIVVTREINKLMAGFSPAALEKLHAAAEEIENEEWTRHWRQQSARSKGTH